MNSWALQILVPCQCVSNYVPVCACHMILANPEAHEVGPSAWLNHYIYIYMHAYSDALGVIAKEMETQPVACPRCGTWHASHDRSTHVST